jgi:hypothetical protein
MMNTNSMSAKESVFDKAVRLSKESRELRAEAAKLPRSSMFRTSLIQMAKCRERIVRARANDAMSDMAATTKVQA